MTNAEIILGIALVIAVVIIVILVRYARRERALRLQKQTGAYRLGASQKVGDLSQLLGTFSVLTEYDELVMLSSTSAQSSLDLIGLKGNHLHFIEFKSKGTGLTKNEKRLRKLIEDKELVVDYRVLDVELPLGAKVTERE